MSISSYITLTHANIVTDPVLLCNELGATSSLVGSRQPVSDAVFNCGRTDMSIKEAVRNAQSNNFMGLICSSRLLELVPALIESIKEAGLVLIVDRSVDASANTSSSVLDLASGVDGLVVKNAVLKFKDTVDQQ